MGLDKKIAMSTDELAKLYVSGTNFTALLAEVGDNIDANNRALVQSGAMEGDQGDALRQVNTKMVNVLEEIKAATKKLDFVLDDRIGKALAENNRNNYGCIDESVVKLINQRLKK